MTPSRAGLAGVGVLVGLWWVGSALVGREILLPSPPLVFQVLREILADSSFLPTLAASIFRWLLGWVISLAGAVCLGSLASPRPGLARFLRPGMVTVRSVPVVSVILLALIWLPLDGVPVFVSLLVSLPLLYQGVLDGLRSVDQDLLDMGRLFRVSLPGRIRHIHLPGASPVILSAAISAAGMSWKAVIAAEVLSQPRLALGTSMHVAKLYLETPRVIAWTIIAVITAALVDGALALLERHLTAWRDGSHGRGAGASLKGPAPEETRQDATRQGTARQEPLAVGKLEEQFPLLFPSPGQATASPGEYPDGAVGEGGMTGEGEAPAGIALRSVSFSFPGVPIFENFDLEIGQESITAILGRSGSGKTTLLRLVAGDLPVSGGAVTVGGSCPGAPWRPRAGFVFQEPRLLPWRSVLDNLLLVIPRYRGRGSPGELRRQVTAFLGTLRLPRSGAYPGSLSGGMKQRVNLTRAFLHGAPLICLDEPLANQDAATRDELRSLIRELWRITRPTMVMVTHSRQEALDLADRIIVLADRHPTRIIGDFYIKDITADQRGKVVQQIGKLLKDT
ncbi:hypothetical protein AU468_04525 [Alkalispirochaeta sphaeroplastigenens]|uniref:ABC transporter domain-containing protein n=1 Tax=Alkalispirochaeta sphaeroplastigenens TaxID=1187066 RepID=A0A2S4JWP3_9SPIO|nr:ATP-binding cassette domain-containing protein [Alkalispirochaeta sphaeroplastigenens]POR03938.1 hypothetical protein AU468_04525 [Alkalispirochaeta sphaeroplastigenens]